jgi:hypothetical protein
MFSPWSRVGAHGVSMALSVSCLKSCGKLISAIPTCQILGDKENLKLSKVEWMCRLVCDRRIISFVWVMEWLIVCMREMTLDMKETIITQSGSKVKVQAWVEDSGSTIPGVGIRQSASHLSW